MKLLTKWQTWWDASRAENKFHCDLLLESGDSVIIHLSTGEQQVISPPLGRFTKVHLEASWEHRRTRFAEEE